MMGRVDVVVVYRKQVRSKGGDPVHRRTQYHHKVIRRELIHSITTPCSRDEFKAAWQTFYQVGQYGLLWLADDCAMAVI